MVRKKSAMEVALLAYFIWTKLPLQLRVVSMQEILQEVMAVKLHSNMKVLITGQMNLHLTNKFWSKVGEFVLTSNHMIPKDWAKANTTKIITSIHGMEVVVTPKVDIEITAQLTACAKIAIVQSIRLSRHFTQVSKFNRNYNNALIIK